MTTYNTGNPIGSTDARDLYDNAQALDEVVNSKSLSFRDRLGMARKTLAGFFSVIDTSISQKLSDVDSVVSSKVEEIDAVIADQFNLAAATSWNYKIGVTPGTAVGQTVFGGLDLAGGNVEVFFNGSRLFHQDDFTFTDTTLMLQAPSAANDVIVINNFRYPVTIIDGGSYA